MIADVESVIAHEYFHNWSESALAALAPVVSETLGAGLGTE